MTAPTSTTVGDNPHQPGWTSRTQLQPDRLIAGHLHLTTQPITLASGSGVVARGTVLGRVTATGKYVPSVATAGDGSQTPVCIAVDTIDATSADAATDGYFSGEFNSNYLVFDASWTPSAITAALQSRAIFLKQISASLSNADPT